MNAPLSPTPLTDVHRTRFYELPTDASKHDCITLALSAISALEDTERSLAERDARIKELEGRYKASHTMRAYIKAKLAAAEARNADQAGRIVILRDVISMRDTKITALEARNAELADKVHFYEAEFVTAAEEYSVHKAEQRGGKHE